MIGLSTSLSIPRSLRNLPQIPAQAARLALDDTRDFLRSELKKNAGKGGARGLNVRTGRLMRSIRTYRQDTSTGGSLGVGAVYYGGILNTGRTLKNGRRKRGEGWIDDALESTRKVFPRYLSRAIDRELAR